jgi:hypothetical protein
MPDGQPGTVLIVSQFIAVVCPVSDTRGRGSALGQAESRRCSRAQPAEQTGRAACLSRMKRLRHQRPRLGIGLIMALAIGTVAGVFGYYGVLVWRFFYD